MGLFSFISGAGKKLFGKKEAPIVATPTAAAPPTKTALLMAEVQQLGIPVTGLNVETSEMISVSGQTATNADREKIILALGNIDCIGCVNDNITVTNPEPEATFHIVKRVDSLSKIAKEVYGDPMKYVQLFEANKPMLGHPDKIYPGQTLRVPPLA